MADFSCEGWSLSELRDVCEELNIRYSRHDTKRVLCDKIKMYHSRSIERTDREEEGTDREEEGTGDEEEPSPHPLRRAPRVNLRAPPPQVPPPQVPPPQVPPQAPPRFVNPALFVAPPQQERDLFSPTLPQRFVNPALFAAPRRAPPLSHFNPQLEEDQEVYVPINYKNTVVNSDEKIECANDNFISMEPYTSIEDTIQIFTLNNQKEYKTSACIGYDELYSLLKSDMETIMDQKDPMPATLKSIYQIPADGSCDTSGRGCIATGKLVIKMPPNNMYITHGSFMRVLSRPEHHWYALPLYGGKKRRIGNVSEIYASSVDHGQIPGYRVYKLFTRQEIEEGVVVKAKFPNTVEDQMNTYESDYYKSTDGEFFDYTIRESDQNLHLSNFDVERITKELFDCYLTTLSVRAFE
jgi:hypothetical protein